VDRRANHNDENDSDDDKSGLPPVGSEDCGDHVSFLVVSVRRMPTNGIDSPSVKSAIVIRVALSRLPVSVARGRCDATAADSTVLMSTSDRTGSET